MEEIVSFRFCSKCLCPMYEEIEERTSVKIKTVCGKEITAKYIPKKVIMYKCVFCKSDEIVGFTIVREVGNSFYIFSHLSLFGKTISESKVEKITNIIKTCTDEEIVLSEILNILDNIVVPYLKIDEDKIIMRLKQMKIDKRALENYLKFFRKYYKNVYKKLLKM